MPHFRRPLRPAWATRSRRVALGKVEHCSPPIHAPLLGAVRLARLDQRRDAEWRVGAVRVALATDETGAGLSEGDALTLADELTEAAAALTALVDVARRLPTPR